MATTYDKASLVMIPSGYKDDKLYSVKPTDGSGDFTFSRDGSGASPATRVNASGLIEKGRTNELTYSNDFSNWTSANTTETSGQSGYDGTNDAWLLSKAASAGNIQLSVSTSGVNTFSYYAKAGTLNWTRLLILGSTNASTYINLSDGSIGVGGGGFIDATATSVGGGWYRVSITHSTAITQVRIYPADADDDTSGTSGNIYIQDAQLEQGLVATDYIETTTAAVSAGLLGDMPRLDYHNPDSPTPNSCPSLLLEPSRVNHYYKSEYFSTGSRVVFTPNAITSPEGVSNATSVVATSLNGSHEVTLSPLISIANTNPRTFSIYAKYNGNHLILNVAGSSINWTACIFDLENGVAKTPQQFGAQTACTADIEDAGNGWYRCSITYTPYASGGFYHLISLTDDVNATLTTWGADNYTGDDVSGIYIYGSQVEEGSYPTSYIPTYGSASGRAVDSCSKTGISSLIGQTEGTLFAEFNFVSNPSDGTNVLTSISDASVNNRITILLNTIGDLRILLNASGVQELDRSTTAPSGYAKIAFAYKSGDNTLYINGVQQWSTADTFTFSTLSRFAFNDYDGDPYANNPLKKSLVFKTRLTNAELAALTA